MQQYIILSHASVTSTTIYLEEKSRDVKPDIDEAVKRTRHFLAFTEQAIQDLLVLPEGFTLQLIDQTLLQREERSEAVLSTWPTLEHFQRYGFGFCILHNGIIVSRCLTDWSSGTRCDIGIWTHEEYRKRGLGTRTALATVNYALEHGYTFIGWHYWDGNVASAATARKVGFQEILTQAVYHAWYNQCDNHLMRAWDYMQAGDYIQAARYRTQALAMLEAQEQDALNSKVLSSHEAQRWFYAQSALLSALTKNGDRAIKQAQRAIELGWTREEFEQMQQEEPFELLHTTPEGRECLAHMQDLHRTIE